MYHAARVFYISPYSQMPVVFYCSVVHGLGFVICEINNIARNYRSSSRNDQTTEQQFLRTTEKSGKRDWRLSALKQP